ncbi:MAG: caspase family protein, partial [Promethearchaeota archaeon]
MFRKFKIIRKISRPKKFVIASFLLSAFVIIIISHTLFSSSNYRINQGLSYFKKTFPVITVIDSSYGPDDEVDGYAVICGVRDYPGTINDLDYCDKDAKNMYNFLKENYGIPKSNIKMLLNDKCTNVSIIDAITSFANQMDQNDYLIFFFSGHGYAYDQNPDGGPFEIVPYNGASEIGLLDSQLDSLLDIVPGKSIVIIDACNSGGMGEYAKQTNRYIITACEPDESSIEDDDHANGLFTYNFFESWTLASDENGDGFLSYEDIFNTLYQRTVQRSAYFNLEFHPMEFDMISGDVILKPGIQIKEIAINSTNDVVVRYDHVGVGAGIMVCAYYDTTNENYTIVTCDNSIVGEKINETYEIPAPASGFQPTAITVAMEARYGNFINKTHKSQALPNFVLDPTNDSDNDGMDDLSEFNGGTNIWNPDTDGDSMNDSIEIQFGLSPFINDANMDLDEDGLSNIWEIEHGLDPTLDHTKVDSDGDRLSDALEYQLGSNPYSKDTDGDGLDDFEEYNIGTSLNESDSDSDHFSDYYELIFGP